MQNEIDIIGEISQKFSQAGIEYMLTGSVAMNYYAQPRMTRDIDVVVALKPADAEAIMSLFGHEYYVDSEAVGWAIAHESLFNMIHQKSVIKVDCIVRKSSEYRRLEFDRRAEVRIQDLITWIVSKEDLIISKLYWAKDSHSEFQLPDVRNLIGTGYDSDYLERWTDEQGLQELFQECLL